MILEQSEQLTVVVVLQLRFKVDHGPGCVIGGKAEGDK